jgi:hypothetical protein
MINKAEKIFSCERCNFQTKYKSTFNYHMSSKLHNEGRVHYSCQECDYESKNKSHMSTHCVLKHASPSDRKEKCKFYCELCDSGMFSQVYYDKHQRSHKHLNNINLVDRIKTVFGTCT